MCNLQGCKLRYELRLNIFFTFTEVITFMQVRILFSIRGKYQRCGNRSFVNFFIIYEIVFLIFLFFIATDSCVLGFPFRRNKFSMRINNCMIFIAHLIHMMCKLILVSNSIMINKINMITISIHAINTFYLFAPFLNQVFW